MLVEQNSKLHMERNYTVSQKHIPSLTGYSFSTSTNFYTFWHMASAEIQKSDAGKIFSNVLLLLNNALK